MAFPFYPANPYMFGGQFSGGQFGPPTGTQTPPNKVNLTQTPAKAKEEVLCWKFNDAKGCAAAPAGQHCNKNGRVFHHRCSKDLNGIICK